MFVLFIGLPVWAQSIAVKSNIFYDITTTLNLGAEARFAPKWTVDFSANYNPFSFSDNKKWKHWMVQPEVRYWFSEAFSRHFVGAHLMGGVFNSGNIDAPSLLSIFPTDKGYRYEGEFAGAGVSYGYHHRLSHRWSLEYSIGLGWIHADYDKYECPHCGDHLKSGKKDFMGVTKAAISLVYSFNRPKNVPKPVVTDTYLPAEVTVAEMAAADTLGNEQPAVEPMKEQPAEVILREAHYTGDFLFAWDSPDINISLPGNEAALDSVVSWLKMVMADPLMSIERIEVVGYASPDGRAEHNRQLSEQRARSFADYLASRVPDLSPQLLHAEGYGEDWESFVRMLADRPLDFSGIDSLLQQAKEHPEQTDRIEYLMRLKTGNILKEEYYPTLRRITIHIVGTRHDASEEKTKKASP